MWHTHTYTHMDPLSILAWVVTTAENVNQQPKKKSYVR